MEPEKKKKKNIDGAMSWIIDHHALPTNDGVWHIILYYKLPQKKKKKTKRCGIFIIS